MEESLTKAYAVLDQERARINNALDLNLKQMLAESAEMISIMKQSVNESLGKYITHITSLSILI